MMSVFMGGGMHYSRLAIARVHPVHLMKVDSAPGFPQAKPVDLGCESAFKLPPSTFTIAICYYYSARKHLTVPRRIEG